MIGSFEITEPVWIRPADLYQTRGVDVPGVVLVGDAFATSCPAAGTGTGKVFTDVERLCNRHIPHWLTTAGMGAEKVAAFYADSDKLAYDAYSLNLAFSLKATSIDPSLKWAMMRWGKFLLRWGLGTVRRLRRRLASAPLPELEAQSHS